MKTIYRLFYLLVIFFITPQVYSQTWEKIEYDGTGNMFYRDGYNIVTLSFVDIDNDQDLDCFIGSSSGTIAFYRNIGDKKNATWELITNNYNNFYSDALLRIKPVFVDIDDDGDYDMFIGGTENPPLYFYRNIGSKSTAEWQQDNSINIIDSIDIYSYHMFKHCYPQFVDIDNDEDYDLIYGNYPGRIVFYENTGDKKNPYFKYITKDYFNLGYQQNCPDLAIVDIDNDNDFDAIIGQRYYVSYVENTGNEDSANWELKTENFCDIKDEYGDWYSPEFCDIDDDGDYDMFVGLGDGSIIQYEYKDNNYTFLKKNPFYVDAGSNLNPSFSDINGDNLLEMYLPSYNEYFDSTFISVYTDTGLKEYPTWTYENNAAFINGFSKDINKIIFEDIDNDGDYDAITGGVFNSVILLYRNIGNSTNPTFDNKADTIVDLNGYELCYFCPILTDIDNDGDYDLYISAQNGTKNSTPYVFYYENTGSPNNYQFIFNSSFILQYGSIGFYDYDLDNDEDIFMLQMGELSLYKNNSTEGQYSFDKEDYELSLIPNGFGISFQNFNNRHKDLIAGTLFGGVLLYKNTCVNGVGTIQIFDNKEIFLKPNPFSDDVTLFYPNIGNGSISVSVYNEHGIKLLEKKNKEEPEIRFNADKLSPGIYIFKITDSNKKVYTRKLIKIE